MDNRDNNRECRNNNADELGNMNRRNCNSSGTSPENDSRCRGRDQFADALEDAYNQGYRDGYCDGFEDGREKGQCEGYQEGVRDGYEKAKQEVLDYIKRNRCCCKCFCRCC